MIQKRQVSFNTINQLIRSKKIYLPDCQGSCYPEKVTEMVQSHLKNPKLLHFKDQIVIGILDDKFYIIDGQHRINMAQKIARMKRPKNDQDYLVFCYTHLEDFEEANEIFNELNKDSHKNRIYIRMSAFQQSVRQDTHVLLKESHNECFSKRKVTQDYKTIASFLDEVSDTGLFDVLPAFNTSPRVLNPTGQQIYDYLIELNDHVFELHGYDNILKEDTDECLYYKKDYPVLNQGCLISLRRCNFDQKLRDIGVDYFHIKKKNKKRIVRTTRNKVWQLHYGKKKRATCPIPNCNKQINFDKFECGHVIPESRGGENVVENLRPICGKCNSSMKNMYWDDYVNRIS